MHAVRETVAQLPHVLRRRSCSQQWVHLRVCLSCGNVGCCDSSPGRHARAHHRDTDHRVIASAEPGETWAHCYLDGTTAAAPDPGRTRTAGG